MKVSNFQQATLSQLLQIARHEECDLIYKCLAESEIERRAEANGTPIIYAV